MVRIILSTSVSGFWFSKIGLKRLAELGYEEAKEYIDSPDEVDGVLYYYGGINIDRDNPLLLQLVDELGDSMLEDGKVVVIEIPDDVDWIVDQYEGGQEFIREKSRHWVIHYDKNPIIK